MSVFFRIENIGRAPLAVVLSAIMASGLLGCATNGAASTQSPAEKSEDWDDDPGLFEWKFTVAPDSEAQEYRAADKAADDAADQAASQPTSKGESSGETSTDNKAGKTATKKPARVYYSAEDDEDGDRGFVLHRSGEGREFDD